MKQKQKLGEKTKQNKQKIRQNWGEKKNKSKKKKGKTELLLILKSNQTYTNYLCNKTKKKQNK